MRNIDKMYKTEKEQLEDILKKEIRVPIYRDCPNEGSPCFCTGHCMDIIGWEDDYDMTRVEFFEGENHAE